jgi:hypothetical protein
VIVSSLRGKAGPGQMVVARANTPLRSSFQ